LTLAMRAAVEDKTRAETEKNDAIETSRSCAASARDDAERRRTTTTLSFASPISSSFPKNARARFLETRYSYELRGVSPDVVASASLLALVSFVIAALVCFALFAFRQRRFQRRVGDELRVARREIEAAELSVKRTNEKAEALRVELALTTRSKAAAVEEVRRSAARDVESAAAMMARLTALAEKAETSANAHRDENETLSSQNAAMKKAVTSLETRLRSAELAVATHEAARERSRRRKEKEKREKKRPPPEMRRRPERRNSPPGFPRTGWLRLSETRRETRNKLRRSRRRLRRRRRRRLRRSRRPRPRLRLRARLAPSCSA
jgi:hypothetical protein